MTTLYSKTNDIDRWKHSYQSLYLIAVVNGFVGLLSFFISSDILNALGGKNVIVASIFIAILALLVHRKKSNIAVWIAAIYWMAEIVYAIYSVIIYGKELLFTGIFLKVFLLYYIAGGLGAVKRLKNTEMNI